ncbi:MAG TPA: MATE family efflux transporter [Clostridiales bacterium]|nr:MATE family efflux transporter [Clostridiales bacterium]
MITDLTEGNISKRLWAFSIPMLISVIFQQLYSIADSVIAGKFIGEDALAAVGASYPISMIFMAVAIGANIGCSVVVSQLFGGKMYKEMKTAITTTFITVGALSVILTVVGLLLSDNLMRLINTPDNIFKDASIYINIYMGGLIFLFLYNICTGIFNALGDSKTPLYFLIGSSIGNIFLDWFFVAVIGMGVDGVAWATFICQGIAGALSLITLIRRLKTVKTEGKIKFFSGSMFKKVSVIAIPSIFQQSFISVGNIIIQSLINGYGSSIIAGYSAGSKLMVFGTTSLATVANGMSSFTAQNIGAGKTERVSKGFKAGCIMALLVALPFFIIYFFFGDTVLKLFLNSDSKLAFDTGKEFLKIIAPFFLAISIKFMGDAVLRGAGAMGWFMVTTFASLFIRIILAYVLAKSFDTTGIWLAWPVGWSLGMILSLIFYIKGVWKTGLNSKDCTEV